MINIGLDLDNCIFDSEPLYKQSFEGTGYKYYLPQKYLIHDTYPREVANKLLSLFRSEATYTTKPYDPTLADYINSLINNQKCNFHIITARLTTGDPLISSFNQLQKFNYQIPITNIHITSLNKTEAINRYNINYMIDDNPHVAEDCIHTNAIPILISNEKTPYNQYLREKIRYYSDVKTALKSIIK